MVFVLGSKHRRFSCVAAAVERSYFFGLHFTSIQHSTGLFLCVTTYGPPGITLLRAVKNGRWTQNGDRRVPVFLRYWEGFLKVFFSFIFFLGGGT